MSPPVLSCQIPRSAHPAFRPAPAHIPEADTPEHVAAEHVVLTSQGDPGNGYGVEHAHTLDGLREGHKSCSTSSTPLAEFVTDTPTERATAVRSPESVPEGWVDRVRPHRYAAGGHGLNVTPDGTALTDGWPAPVASTTAAHVRLCAAAWTEAERVAFLRRVQYVDPRTRKA